MSRPSKETYDLSDAEKRDLIELIQQGKALPEKYRFILFEDKREVELVCNGKTRDVCAHSHMRAVKDTRERLTKRWTGWVDDWAVDFDDMSRKQIIKVPVAAGLDAMPSPQPSPASGRGSDSRFEQRWSGGHIFENEWPSFRTRLNI